MVNRRTAIAAAAGLAGGLPILGTAQTGELRRIGFLSNSSQATGSVQVESFRSSLRELGWIEGKSILIEYRWAEGDLRRLPALASELVRAKVEVLFVSGPVGISAAQKATRTLPIVFVVLVDPVALGFAQSLAHPGGNLTGLASQFEELVTKQLQLLKESVPGLSRITLLRHAEASPAILSAAEKAAGQLELAATTLTVSHPGEFEGAFRQAQAERSGAMHVLPSPSFGAQRRQLIDLAARFRLPAFYELRLYVEDGGLMSYGPSIDDLYGRSATYVDRILKGARPGDLAIERPARFEFVVNRRTAEALGAALARTLMLRADEVIG
jgi:putative ABC transport system substrate-binding protein